MYNTIRNVCAYIYIICVYTCMCYAIHKMYICIYTNTHISYIVEKDLLYCSLGMLCL